MTRIPGNVTGNVSTIDYGYITIKTIKSQYESFTVNILYFEMFWPVMSQKLL